MANKACPNGKRAELQFGQAESNAKPARPLWINSHLRLERSRLSRWPERGGVLQDVAGRWRSTQAHHVAHRERPQMRARSNCWDHARALWETMQLAWCLTTRAVLESPLL